MAWDEKRPLCEPAQLLRDPWDRDPLRESIQRERERIEESPGIESPARMPSGLFRPWVVPDKPVTPVGLFRPWEPVTPPWVPYVEPSGRGLGRRARRVACSAVEDPAVEVSSAHSVSNRERAEERKECAGRTARWLPGPSPRPRLGAQMRVGGAVVSGWPSSSPPFLLCMPSKPLPRRRELPPRLLCGRAGCLNTDFERKHKSRKS